MKLPLLRLFTLLGLALARTRHGKNKPGVIEFFCAFQNCNYEQVYNWMFQACEGIGGHDLTMATPLLSGSSNEKGDLPIVGGKAVCVCAHGNTVEATYPWIVGPYPQGHASLTFNIDGYYGCQRTDFG